METRKSGQLATDVLSPSRITDYYNCSKKELSKDLKEVKGDKSSSVYLTPECSPTKDNQNEDSKSQIIISDSEVDKSRLCNKSSSGDVDNSDGCELGTGDVSPQKVFKKENVNTSQTATSVNGCVKEEIVSDTSKRKSGPHRICRIASTNSDSIQTTQATSVETVAVSSPSLPRPKVRKDSKLASVESDNKPSKSVSQSTTTKPKPGRKKKTDPVQSTAITDYFPIRRSGRQTKSQIEKETMLHIEQLIQSNCEDGLEVKEFEGKGRGVIATKMFDKGDFVVEYAGDLLDVNTAQDRELKYAQTPSIGCYMYFFNHKDNQYCVDATAESGRVGRLINHSRNGNCGTKVVMLEDKPRLILVAAKQVKKGEELSYDYGDRSKASLEAHPWLKL